MSQDKKLYVWSLDEEMFHHGGEKPLTRAEAILDGASDLDCEGSDRFWIGVKSKIRAEDLALDADSILEGMEERAFEKAGEASEGWPDVTRDEMDDLAVLVRNAVKVWADKHGKQPSFFAVDEAEAVCQDDAEVAT